MKYDAAEALSLLRHGSGRADASFREDQEAAIRHVVEGRGRLLVVQKTGWGKSFVYFIATKLLRNGGAGPALLISPLLALMRNQIAAAERMGLRAETINSTNTEDWGRVEAKIARNEIDILLISPERLANDRFRDEVLAQVAGQVALLVIDEAHCISDWGHDFRPHYRLIERVARTLPPSVRLLATTATANARVQSDLREVLGPNVEVVRGDLNRPSLKLQTIRLEGQGRTPRLACRCHSEAPGPRHHLHADGSRCEPGGRLAPFKGNPGGVLHRLDRRAASRVRGRPARESRQGAGRHHRPRDGVRQARSRLRDPLPDPGLGRRLLPASGTSWACARCGIRSHAER